MTGDLAALADDAADFIAELRASRDDYFDHLIDDKGFSPMGALLIIKSLAGYL